MYMYVVTKMERRNSYKLVALVPLLLLPGCLPEWLGGKKAEQKAVESRPSDNGSALTGDAIVLMNGKPVITKDSLEAEFDQLLEDNPQFKSVLPFMPDAKINFLQGMINQAVVDEYIDRRGISQTVAYQNDMATMMRQVKRMLNTKYFGLENPVDVSSSEVKKFYEDNKDTMPELLISQGGVSALGVQFEAQDTAEQFMNKVKGGDFAQIAQSGDTKDHFTDFKLVNKTSVGIDPLVRSKIVGMKKFPSLDMVKVSDSLYWVVYADKKEEPTYRPFEQVKAGLEQFVKKEKTGEVFEKRINELKQEYNIVVNDAVLKTMQPEAAQEMQNSAIALPQKQAAGTTTANQKKSLPSRAA